MKYPIFMLLMAALSLIFAACPSEPKSKNAAKTAQEVKKKNTETYHFKYNTIIANLERDCADSKLDERIYWLNQGEEDLFRGIKVSLEEENTIGAQVHECFKKAPFIKGEPLQRVQKIVDAMQPFLVRKNEFDLKVFVINLDYENAFACPGGYVYVTKALLDKFDDDALACVVGHELCHLENKHSHVHIKQYKLMGGLITNLMGCFTQALSQRNELEADLGGLFLAAKAGYNPKAAATTFERWAAAEGKPTTLGKIFRSHPYSQERVQCVNAYLNDAKKRAEGLAKIQ